MVKEYANRTALVLILLAAAIPVHGQQNPQQGHGAPSGVCSAPYVDIDTGNFYVCKVGQFSLTGTPPNVSLPPSTSGPGPVFNVKNYGAKGDAISCDVAASTGSGTTTMTGACNWAAPRDLNKSLVAFVPPIPYNQLFLSTPTITAVNSSSNITLSVAQGGGNVTSLSIVWGTIDDAAVASAAAAALAAASGAVGQVGNKTPFTGGAPTLYFPAGAYLLCSNSAAISLAKTGFTLLGDGPDQTIIYLSNGNGCNMGGWFTQQSGFGSLIIKGITFDGINSQQPAPMVTLNGEAHMYDVHFQRNSNNNTTAACFQDLGTIYADKVWFVQCGNGASFSGFGEVYEWVASNNTVNNITVTGSKGTPNGGGMRFINGLNDECTGQHCFNVINSTDVWLQGMASFSGATKAGDSCLHVDGNSFVHWEGGACGVFLQDTNENGALIDAGGILQASDVRFISSGTGKCMTNNGVFNDNGGNSCESQFLIASGTSTGTTAVLTLTPGTSNVNTNCSVGDALLVTGASIAGYNGYYPAGATSGITAVTTTTLTYTTVGSNLGALGAGGAAYCRNLQTYSGTLPKALLNNPIPNTCYITGTFAATTAAAPMCAFKLGSATNITAIKAASTTTTACTVAPVVTISDGTVSETLTITTAKSIWDSSVDASTGVGTSIFKPNGTITLSNTAGTCTTPPTNFSVSYNISPILSN